MNPNTDYIYESPDGGHTIYRRRFGDSERELLYEDEFVEIAKARMEWLEIFDKKNSNPTLQAAMDRVILIHRLTKNNG